MKISNAAILLLSYSFFLTNVAAQSAISLVAHLGCTQACWDQNWFATWLVGNCPVPNSSVGACWNTKVSAESCSDSWPPTASDFIIDDTGVLNCSNYKGWTVSARPNTTTCGTIPDDCLTSSASQTLSPSFKPRAPHSIPTNPGQEPTVPHPEVTQPELKNPKSVKPNPR